MATKEKTRPEQHDSGDAEVAAAVALSRDLASVNEYQPLGAHEPIKVSRSIALRYFAKKTTSGKQASELDIDTFLMVCRLKRLNPWLNDAYLVGYDERNKSGQVTGANFSIITAYTALAKRAEMHPQYDGVESGIIVRTGDDIQKLDGEFHTPDQLLEGAWCRVWRKDRTRPFYCEVRLSAFKKNSPFWRDMPEHMITKCCKAYALREQFPAECGGLYTPEETIGTTGPPRSESVMIPTESEPAKPTVTAEDLTRPAAQQAGDAETVREAPDGKVIPIDDPDALMASFLRAIKAADSPEAIQAIYDLYDGKLDAGELDAICTDRESQLQGDA